MMIEFDTKRITGYWDEKPEKTREAYEPPKRLRDLLSSYLKSQTNFCSVV